MCQQCLTPLNKSNIIAKFYLYLKTNFISEVLLIILSFSYNLTFSQTTTDSTVTLSTNQFIDEKIDYDAEDSIRFDVVNQRVYLYGKAFIKYGDIELTAGNIDFDFKTKTVRARPILDSNGKETSLPVFKEGDQSFTAKSMDYNFDTKKGLVVQAKTKQDDGYLHGEIIKNHSSHEQHIKDAKYTTCSLDHPHYYFGISRAIKKEDVIVAGPLMVYVNDVPTPLALPFGFFPDKKNKGAGFIIPTYDNSERYGIGFLNGGYYIPFRDSNGNGLWDLRLTGSIYTRGNYGFQTASQYKKIYKYNGNLSFNYQLTKSGHEDLNNLNKSKNFSLRWSHNQDAKARPNSSFSANVNISSINNFRESFTATGEEFLTNTFASSIQYRRSIPNSPFSFNINANHNQNTQTKIVSLTLPDISWNMNRINPLEFIKNTNNRSNVFIKELSKIWLTWNSQFQNKISVPDSTISINNIPYLQGQLRNGIQHQFSSGTSFKVLNKKVNFNPSIRFTERWYLQTLNKYYDNTLGESVSDTLRGPSNWGRAHTYSLSAQATTKLYGYYGFAKFLQTYRKTKIRHVLTPSLNFSYNPSFDSRQYGFFGEDGALSSYSPYDLGVFGPPSPNQSGRVGLNLVNNLEMKMNTKSDTGFVEKKYSIIDNFSFTGNYDIFKDSLKFSNISMNARTTLFKMFSINANASLDPYYYDTVDGIITKLDKSIYSINGKLGRITSANMALNFNLNQEKFKRKVEEIEKEDEVLAPELQDLKNNPENYVDFEVPWNASFSYNINYRRSYQLKYDAVQDVNRILDTATITQTIDMSGDINLTPKWKVGVWMNYDITNKKLAYTSINIYRDLHCWEMSFNWIPFGPQQSYNFQINVKSSTLKDLKINRKRAWFDNQIQ